MEDSSHLPKGDEAFSRISEAPAAGNSTAVIEKQPSVVGSRQKMQPLIPTGKMDEVAGRKIQIHLVEKNPGEFVALTPKEMNFRIGRDVFNDLKEFSPELFQGIDPAREMGLPEVSQLQTNFGMPVGFKPTAFLDLLGEAKSASNGGHAFTAGKDLFGQLIQLKLACAQRSYESQMEATTASFVIVVKKGEKCVIDEYSQRLFHLSQVSLSLYYYLFFSSRDSAKECCRTVWVSNGKIIDASGENLKEFHGERLVLGIGEFICLSIVSVRHQIAANGTSYLSADVFSFKAPNNTSSLNVIRGLLGCNGVEPGKTLGSIASARQQLWNLEKSPSGIM